jgi:hypothetical protein
MTVWLHEERSSVLPYGAPYQRTMFTSDRIAIEKLNCTLATERYTPRDSFAGHQMSTPWDPLHGGEALWTYLISPEVERTGEHHSKPGPRFDPTRPNRSFAPKIGCANKRAQPFRRCSLIDHLAGLPRQEHHRQRRRAVRAGRRRRVDAPCR